MQLSSLKVGSKTLITLVCVALVWGVFSGRHNGPVSSVVVYFKDTLLGVVAPDRRWHREFYNDEHQNLTTDCPTNPLVIVTLGQSNAANFISSPIDENPNVPAYMFFNDTCYFLRDPVLGATGSMGSLWTALGHRLVPEVNRPVLFINGAVNGTRYSDWLKEKSGYLSRLIDSVSAANELGFYPELVIWVQGESERYSDQTSEKIFHDIRDLAILLYQEFQHSEKLTFIIFRASNCQDPSPEVVRIQERAIEELPFVIAGPNLDTLGLRYRYDDCHFNERGRNEIVRELIPLILSTVGTT